jgi:hypothetical protein
MTDYIHLDYPYDDVLDVEIRLMVNGGCHPDCQHLYDCARCGLLCKAVYEKLKSSRRART